MAEELKPFKLPPKMVELVVGATPCVPLLTEEQSLRLTELLIAYGGHGKHDERRAVRRYVIQLMDEARKSSGSAPVTHLGGQAGSNPGGSTNEQRLPSRWEPPKETSE